MTQPIRPFDRPYLWDGQSTRQIVGVVQRVEAAIYFPAQRRRDRATGGGTIGNWYCNPSGSIAGFSGSWTGGSSPSLSPGTGTADVYQNQGGSLVKVASGATINNFYNSATTAGQVLKVEPNGDGTYDIIDQSCT